jgi:mono/diheme cytochrome c family protein
MKIRFVIAALLLAGGMLLGLTAVASSGVNAPGKDKDAPKDATAAAAPAATGAQDENMRLEGEKRFRSNCGRCHTAPPKFPPRMMATIARHMRVRAAITDQDMRMILRYMTE